MRFKLLSVMLLLVSFLLLGVLSRSIPILGLDDTAAVSAIKPQEPVVPFSPPPVDTPAPTKVPPTPTAEPTGSPMPTDTPAPAPAAVVEHPWQPSVTVISTTITSDDPLKNETAYDVDGRALLANQMHLTLPAEGYQILIIHTHATEAYTPEGADQYEAAADYRTTDAAHSVIRVGEVLAQALESYGLSVLHDTELYDWPSYNGSYARSGEAIEEYLAQYPSIAMVIDLHRDAIGDDEKMYKTVSSDEGAAQIMFVMGSDGSFQYPDWRENLGLAMSLQALVDEQYPTLMRPTLLCDYRYNQQLTTGSLLMEIGAAGNTLQEAIEAAELFAQAVGPSLASCIRP